MLVVLAQLACCKHKCLGDQEYSFEYLWVLVVEEISFANKSNQFIHEAFKLIRIFLSAMMNNGAKGAQTAGDEPWQVSALCVVQMRYHKWQKEISLHIATKQLSNFVCSGSYLRLFVQNILVNDIFQDLVAMWFDFVLSADD